MGTKHVMPQFIKRSKDGANPYYLYGAHQTRAFCYVDDAVRATLCLAKQTTQGIFHIGNDEEEVEIIELANVINNWYSNETDYIIKKNLT